MDEKRLPNEQEGLKKDQGMGPQKDTSKEQKSPGVEKSGEEKIAQPKIGEDVKR